MRSWADDEPIPGHEIDVPALAIFAFSIAVLITCAAGSMGLWNMAENRGFARASALYAAEMQRLITAEEARCHEIVLDALGEQRRLTRTR